MYRIANGTFCPEAADFVYKVYHSYLAPVARKIVEIDLCLDKDNRIDIPETEEDRILHAELDKALGIKR
jgi:hypothetical protein